MILPLSQAFAISGGPVYPGGTNVVGTYAGVLKPGCIACKDGKQTIVKCKELGDFLTEHPNYTDCSDPFGCSANSLGVFSIGVPTTGTSTGTFVMFAQGRVFNGTVSGTADPGTSRLRGVLSATFNFTLSEKGKDKDGNDIILTSEVTAMANGNLNTKIATTSSSTTSDVTATRLSGTATLDISHGFVDPGTLEPIVTCEMNLVANGFKQSSSAPTTLPGGG